MQAASLKGKDWVERPKSGHGRAGNRVDAAYCVVPFAPGSCHMLDLSLLFPQVRLTNTGLVHPKDLAKHYLPCQTIQAPPLSIMKTLFITVLAIALASAAPTPISMLLRNDPLPS